MNNSNFRRSCVFGYFICIDLFQAIKINTLLLNTIKNLYKIFLKIMFISFKILGEAILIFAFVSGITSVGYFDVNM